MVGINVHKYRTIIKASIIKEIIFKTNTYLIVIGNFLYLLIVYFLWKSIFESNGLNEINGMTFNDTLIYLVLASAMATFFNCNVTWGIALKYQSGAVALEMVKPVDFQFYWFCLFSGEYIVSFLFTFLPTFIVVIILTKGYISFGINTLYFIFSMIIALFINYFIDYIVGLLCFKTKSIWGINIMKESIVSLLSGLLIPIAFFPEKFMKVVMWLPFYTIYDTPLRLLLNNEQDFVGIFSLLLKQLMWATLLMLLSRFLWRKIEKNITINGG